MAFPINFAVGAAIGAVTTYVYKDESAKQKVISASQSAKKGISSGATRVKGLFKKSPKAETEAVAEEKATAEAKS